LCAGFIFASASVDNDLLTNFHESSNLQLSAIFKFGSFHYFAGGVSAYCWFSVSHFTHNRVWWCYRNYFAFIEHRITHVFHAVFNPWKQIAQLFAGYFVLVEFWIHEYIHWVGVVRVSYFFTIQLDVFEFIVGAIYGFGVNTAEQVFQLHFYNGGVAARLVVFRFLDNPG